MKKSELVDALEQLGAEVDPRASKRELEKQLAKLESHAGPPPAPTEEEQPDGEGTYHWVARTGPNHLSGTGFYTCRKHLLDQLRAIYGQVDLISARKA